MSTPQNVIKALKLPQTNPVSLKGSLFLVTKSKGGTFHMLQLCLHRLDGNQQQKLTHWSTVIRAEKNSD